MGDIWVGCLSVTENPRGFCIPRDLFFSIASDRMNARRCWVVLVHRPFNDNFPAYVDLVERIALALDAPLYSYPFQLALLLYRGANVEGGARQDASGGTRARTGFGAQGSYADDAAAERAALRRAGAGSRREKKVRA